jgi:hypothetical protein
LVQADQTDQHHPHRRPGSPERRPHVPHERVTRARESSSSTSVTRSRERAPWIVPRATSATSNPSGTVGATSRHAARMMRRALLRKTARPTRRPATNATFPVPGATNSTTRFPWNARPVARTRPTSDVPVVNEPALRRQSSAALRATTGDDRPAGARAHAEPEAVALGPPPIVRLKCALRHGSPFGTARYV